MNRFSLLVGILGALAADTALAQDSAQFRLGVLQLEGEGRSQALSTAVTESLSRWAANTGIFETISPAQIRAIVQHDKRRDLFGQCKADTCYQSLGRVLEASHLVTGTLAKTGASFTLNLILIDTKTGSALRRTTRQATGVPELLKSAERGLAILLQPLLSKHQGFLRLAGNADVHEAAVAIDGVRRPERIGKLVTLAAGPHVLRVTREGFYPLEIDVMIRPTRITEHRLELIPAPDTIANYERKARRARFTAWTTAALSLTTGVLAAYFYDQASGHKAVSDGYALAVANNQNPEVSLSRAVQAEDAFGSNQTLYLSLLGGAVVSGMVSTYLFSTGGAPDRYEEFKARREARIRAQRNTDQKRGPTRLKRPPDAGARRSPG